MVLKSSGGICLVCGKKIAPSTAKKHLTSCLEKRKSVSAPTSLFLLFVEGYGYGNHRYWMYLLMPEHAKFRDMDKFLRKIWLECCGHLSEYRIGRNLRIGMNRELGDVLGQLPEFAYIYDFGSSTMLRIMVAGKINGNIRKGKVELVARNDMPKSMCQECGEEATLICPQCACEDNGWFCDECAETHDCGLGSFLPVLNSPRTGVCGYTGQPW